MLSSCTCQVAGNDMSWAGIDDVVFTSDATRVDSGLLRLEMENVLFRLELEAHLLRLALEAVLLRVVGVGWYLFDILLSLRYSPPFSSYSALVTLCVWKAGVSDHFRAPYQASSIGCLAEYTAKLDWNGRIASRSLSRRSLKLSNFAHPPVTYTYCKRK